MSTTTTLPRWPLVALVLAALPSACAFFTLEAPCTDDSNCPYGRVCATTDACVARDDPRAPHASEGEGEGSGEGEGEGSGEGEGAAFVPCSGDDVVDGDVDLPGDENALDPPGNTCVHVHGRVRVQGSIDDLSAMQRVQSIDNDFEVQNTDIVDFTGCEQLQEVGGNFSVSGNDALASFHGLENLQSVNGCDISNNPDLSPSALATFEQRCP